MADFDAPMGGLALVRVNGSLKSTIPVESGDTISVEMEEGDPEEAVEMMEGDDG